MAKNSKKRYKQFTVDTLEKACFVLKTLIVPVITDLEKLIRYNTDAENLLNEYKQNGSVPAKKYEIVHDCVLYQQRELLRFIADYQSSSFSYIAIRETFVKKKFLKRNISEENRQTLNDLLDIRNWTFHNTQSMLVAELEHKKKRIPEELQGMAEIHPILNPVVVRKVQSYSLEMLKGFIEHNNIRIKQFQMVLREMKADYQEMYNELPSENLKHVCIVPSKEIVYIEQKANNDQPDKDRMATVAVSVGIQKGKYDGTDISYQKLLKEKG